MLAWGPEWSHVMADRVLESIDRVDLVYIFVAHPTTIDCYWPECFDVLDRSSLQLLNEHHNLGIAFGDHINCSIRFQVEARYLTVHFKGSLLTAFTRQQGMDCNFYVPRSSGYLLHQEMEETRGGSFLHANCVTRLLERWYKRCEGDMVWRSNVLVFIWIWRRFALFATLWGTWSSFGPGVFVTQYLRKCRGFRTGCSWGRWPF